jgi:ABC-type multidrug transport system fused ATPase/permease subunit
MIKIQQALIQLRGKMTILIISHQTEMSQFADQSIFLAQ